MKIYKPFIQIIHNDDLSLIKKGEFPELFDIYDYGGVSLFSTKENAIKDLKEKLESYSNEMIIQVGISVESCDKDEESIVFFLDHNLNEIGFIDWNIDREITQIDYKKGDWVYFIQNNKLILGMIGWEAEKTEPYYIIYEDSNINDCSPHGHIDPLFIWKIADQDEAKNTLPWKYFRNIQMRYQEFISHQEKRKK